MVLVGRDVDHVGAILAGAHDPVDLRGGGIVAGDGLGAFSGEIQLAAHEGKAVRSAERSGVDVRQSLLRDQIDDGERVIAAEAVDGNVGGFTVGGGDDFMGVGSDRRFCDDLECGGIDDGEGVIVLGKREEGLLRGGLR